MAQFTPTPKHIIAGFLLAQAGQRRDSAAPATAEANLTSQLLEKVARLVMELEDTDERVVTLVSLAVRHDEFYPGPFTMSAIQNYGPHDRRSPQEFLEWMVRLAREDALQRARESGVLPPWQGPKK